MLTGSIGTPTVIATVVVTLLTTARAGQWWQPALLLVGGLAVLVAFVRSKWVGRHLNAWLLWGLKKWTSLDVRDYVSLLQLQNGYAVTEMLVEHNDWLDRKTLQDAALSREGVLVLGIQYTDGTYHGTPRAADVIEAGNTLVLYGPIDRMKELDERSSAFGESAHQQAIMEQAAQTLTQEASPSVKNMGPS